MVDPLRWEGATTTTTTTFTTQPSPPHRVCSESSKQGACIRTSVHPSARLSSALSCEGRSAVHHGLSWNSCRAPLQRHSLAIHSLRARRPKATLRRRSADWLVWDAWADRSAKALLRRRAHRCPSLNSPVICIAVAGLAAFV